MECRKFDNDSGISPVIGIILIIAITLVLSVVVYATISVYEVKEPVFAIIEIESVNVSNQEVVLVHRGGNSFDVSDINILISINGETLEKNLINLPDFQPVGFNDPLSGVLWKPSGATANYNHDNIWDLGDKGDFNIAGTNSKQFKTGDLLTVTIYHRPTNTIISSPERRI